MRGFVGLILIVLATNYGVGGLDFLELLGTDIESVARLADVVLPDLNSVDGGDGLRLCNVTASDEVLEAKEACLEELKTEMSRNAEEVEPSGRKSRGRGRGRGRPGRRGGARQKRSTPRGVRRSGGRRRGGRGGKGSGGRRPSGAAAGPSAGQVESCIFRKLEMVDSEGNVNPENVRKSIKNYRGDKSGMELMDKITERCLENLGQLKPEKQVAALMGCVRRDLAPACAAHGVKLQSPELSLLMTSHAAQHCLDDLQMPPKMVWSSIRCSAEHLQDIANVRLQAFNEETETRRKRSPQREERRKEDGESTEPEDHEGRSAPEIKDDERSGSPKENRDNKRGSLGGEREEKRGPLQVRNGRPKDGGTEDGTPSVAPGTDDQHSETADEDSTDPRDSRPSFNDKGPGSSEKDEDDDDVKDDERERKMKNEAAGKGRKGKQQPRESQTDRLEALIGPVQPALEAARGLILKTSRCMHQAAGTLDGDRVILKAWRDSIEKAGGNDKVKGAVLEAMDRCSGDNAVDIVTECMASELSVTCPAAMRPNKRDRGRGGGRRRPTLVAGRPPRVAALQLPAELASQLVTSHTPHSGP